MRIKRPEPIAPMKIVASSPGLERSSSASTDRSGQSQLAQPWMRAVGDLAVAIDEAYSAVKAMMDAGNFKGAAKFLQALEKRLVPGVVAKILGNAPKFSAIKITADQLADIIRNTTGQLSKAAIDAIKGSKATKAGEWNKPGNMRADAYIGSDIHLKIAIAYREANPLDLVDTNHIPIKSILERRFPGVGKPGTLSAQELGVKPDILNITKQVLYEIKPETNVADAVLERDAYIGLFAAAGVKIAPGAMTAPGANGVVQAPGGYAYYYSPLPGVILYKKKNGDFDPAKLPIPFTRTDQSQVKDENENEQPNGRRVGGNSKPGGLTPQPAFAANDNDLIHQLEVATGLSGLALLLYMITRTAGRIVFPGTNIIPLP
jgi:hypothetical protein